MKRTIAAAFHSVILSLAASVALAAPEAARAPEFTHRDAGAWINSAPLQLSALRGKVVLVEFWTFDCINCLRSLPWMKATANAHQGDDLVIVSVHTPELPQEKVSAN